MPIPNPSLDEKTFEEILDEAKKNLSVRSKKWTNYNESDPGITLLELFCWLADNQIYTLNRMGKKNLLKFLKLLGKKPNSPIPEKVIASFQVSKPTKIIKGTKLALEDDSDEIYETDKDLAACSVEIKRVLVSSASEITDHTEIFGKKSIDVFGFFPNIGNSVFFGIKSKETERATVNFFIEVDHNELDKFPFGTHCNFDKFYQSAYTKWQYLKIDDNGKRRWKSLDVTDATFSLAQSGYISVQLPFDMMTKTTMDNSELEYFWISCSFTGGHYEMPPKIKAIRPNSVSATKGTSIIEKIGVSNGLPNQRFPLSHKPLSDVFDVTVKDTKWHMVDDFDSSGPDDSHYIVSSQQIVFGNGIEGDVPPSGYEIHAAYRFGNPVSKPSKNNFVIFENETKNIASVERLLYKSGKNEETLEDALSRARSELRTPYKLVSKEDWIQIAKNTPGLRVAKASVFGDPASNLVNVVVIPYSIYPNPQPSQGFLRTVSEHLNCHRLLTTQIRVTGPNYIQIGISSDIYVSDYANPDDILKKIIDSLDSFLDSAGKEDGWIIGRPVYRSEVYSVIKSIEGVKYVDKPYLRASGKNNTFHYQSGMMWIDESSIVYPGQHIINVKRSSLLPQNRRNS